VPRPRITAHRSVLERFSRYDATHRLNSVVMGRQFNMPGYAFPDQHRRSNQIYDDVLSLDESPQRYDDQRKPRLARELPL
jgi:hypothetical protein